MKEVIIYTTAICPYCLHAKQLLERQGISFTEIKVDDDPTRRKEMEELSRRRTVPQIFIGGRHVGGFDDLAALQERDELKDWIA